MLPASLPPIPQTATPRRGPRRGRGERVGNIWQSSARGAPKRPASMPAKLTTTTADYTEEQTLEVEASGNRRHLARVAVVIHRPFTATTSPGPSTGPA